MNIAIIGSGGREHAIAWKLRQSPLAGEVYILPGNGGIKGSVNLDVDTKNFHAIRTFCKEKNIKLIVVGPEVPLTEGIADYFSGTDVQVFGVKQQGARLEGSKIWAKDFMHKYGVATATSRIFPKPMNGSDVEEVIKRYNGNLVLKYDGLAAGKGVYVCDSIDSATMALKKLMYTYQDELELVVEKKLTGEEISVIGITDGKVMKLLSVAQDHKRLLDNDEGPNTGGMGACTPVKICTPELMQKIQTKIIEPTLTGLQHQQIDYRGVMFFGIMLDEGEPYLLEYNVRFGDPETEVILPALRNDLLEIILKCLDGTLAEVEIQNSTDYFIDVVAVAGGYPEKYKSGDEITGLENVDKDILVFHAGTKKSKNKLVTSGGRVLNIVASGATFEDARDKVYAAIEKISFNNMFYRKDIGNRSL